MSFSRFFFAAAMFMFLSMGLANPAFAYIGPGAGFAFLYSFFVIFLIIFIAPMFILMWPVWYLIHRIRTGGGPKNARVKRVVVLGLDGLDPVLTQKFISQGKLPNFKKLSGEGSFHPLKTTHPSVSPVAWSSFQTGVNPSKHNIFDFLDRDLNSYTPKLSSAFIGGSSEYRKIGPFKIPKGKAVLRLLRKSQPFWKILGEKGVFSTILRVPITFPPEKFYGLSLSAMCTPDLKGTQGTFSCYSDKSFGSGAGSSGESTGGMQIPVQWNNGEIETYISGPVNSLSDKPEEMRIPLKITRRNGGVDLKLNGAIIHLDQGKFTDWLKVEFKAGLGIKAAGICRFYLTELEPGFILYMTPINIDPEKPSLPVSYPLYYSVYLAKLQGSYSTLGLAEDTWALNEGILTDEAFLKQAWDIHEEREQMFFHALKMTRKGLVACVFDTSDRIQHMFWRQLEPEHPANLGQKPPEGISAIEDMYVKLDDLTGRTMAQMGKDDVLMVISDHGFKSFQRCFSINAWLKENGYLVLKEGAEGGDFFEDVDWNRTKAYGVGLSGMFINLQGREKNGVVAKGEEYESLKKELISKLEGLDDPERKQEAIHRIFDLKETGTGPYGKNGPDLLFGFNPGWRVSWDTVTGDTRRAVFSDNIKKWSGDHCIEPRQVPGVFFSNRKSNLNDPDLRDISATTLDLFGVKIPDYIEGRPLMAE